MKDLKVWMDFADTNIRAIDYIQDLRKATDHARLNLFGRYNIRLEAPMPDGDRVYLELRIPDELADGFKCSKRLKGIASWLLRYGEGYDKHVVQNRLLVYTIADAQSGLTISEASRLTGDEKIKVIERMAALLLRTDDVATKRVQRIIDILEECD